MFQLHFFTLTDELIFLQENHQAELIEHKISSIKVNAF